MTTRRRKRHPPEQIVRNLRDAEAMLNAGQYEAAVLQALEISSATYLRWMNQSGGMKSEEAKPLKQLEDENKHLKELVAEKELDIGMLRHVASETGKPFPQEIPQLNLHNTWYRNLKQVSRFPRRFPTSVRPRRGGEPGCHPPPHAQRPAPGAQPESGSQT